MNDRVIALLVAFVLGGGLMALGAWAYPKLRKEVQGYPAEQEIEALLLPLVFNAICSAYKVSEMAMTEVGKAMEALDKKAIADRVYDMLPDKIGGIPLDVVKTIITRQRFATLVQEVFDRFMEFYTSNEGKFADLFAKWKLENG